LGVYRYTAGDVDTSPPTATTSDWPYVCGLLLLAAFTVLCLYAAFTKPGGDDVLFDRSVPAHRVVHSLLCSPGREKAWANCTWSFPQPKNMRPIRLPFTAIAVMFAASLWYLAQRQYGAWSGVVALALLCFSLWVLTMASHASSYLLGS